MSMLLRLLAAAATATAAAPSRRPNLLFLASDGAWLSSPPSCIMPASHAAC